MEFWQATDEDVAALLQARHGDPFAVLGPHRVDVAPRSLLLKDCTDVRSPVLPQPNMKFR